MFSGKNALTNVALLLVMAVMLGTMLSFHAWNRSKPNERGVIKWDVISYYSYLPATFIYGDVTLGFLDDPSFNNDNKFWPYRLENGNRLIQTSMGLSILYSPFFFMAHGLAPLFGQPRDGYSNIYQFFLVLSSLFYVMTGLLFLRKILLKYFPALVTAVVLFLLPLATNLFYYTIHEGAMPHAYNFALLTVFVFLVIRWYERPALRTTLWLGLIYGLIVLVRPSNVLAGILFLLWGVTGFRELGERIRFLMGKFPLLLLLGGCFILVWIPQLLYWKAVTGSYLFNSYGPSGSSFFFGSPHIPELLFSYRKGWFLYTPLMLLATAGLLTMGKKCKEGQWAITLYLAVEIYVLASWWSWWNGGSFGLRSFVDIYGVMALPLAALVDTMVRSKKYLRLAFAGLLLFFMYMNLFQTFQYTRGFIHHTGMTREAYWLNFLRFKSDGSSWQMLSVPDAQLARMGIYYNYYSGDDNSELKAMKEAEGRELIRREIEGDQKLTRQIQKASRRQGISYRELLQQVVDRVYETRTSS
jgi:hypothetical protein